MMTGEIARYWDLAAKSKEIFKYKMNKFKIVSPKRI